jgi:hypothetical protein
MSNDNVSDFEPLLVSQGNRDTAGVNGHAIVDQKTGQTLLKGRYAVGVKRAV